MTIAELVIKIAFQANDPEFLSNLDKGLKSARENAEKLAAAVGKVSAAKLKLVATAPAAGGGLAKEMGEAAKEGANLVAWLAVINLGLERLRGNRINSESGAPIRLGVNELPPGTTPLPMPGGGRGGELWQPGNAWGLFSKPTFGQQLNTIPLFNREKIMDLAKGLTVFTTALDAVNYGLLKIATSGAKAALSLAGFHIQTGESIQDLQKWQAAMMVMGVASDETLQTFVAIKDAQAAVRLGVGNFAPFQFFGLDVNEKDAGKILEQVRQMSKLMDPNLARQFAQQLGITDNVFQGLMRVDLKDTGILLTDDQNSRLLEFSQNWSRLLRDLTQFKNVAAVILAPAFNDIARGLEWLVKKGEEFAEWLDKPGNEQAKKAFEGLVVAMAILGALLPVLIGALVAFVTVLVSPELAAGIAAVLALGAAFNFVYGVVEKLTDAIGNLVDDLGHIPGLGGLANVALGRDWNYTEAKLTRPHGQIPGVTTVVNHVAVSVDGAMQPAEVAETVATHLKRITTAAMSNVPAFSY